MAIKFLNKKFIEMLSRPNVKYMGGTIQIKNEKWTLYQGRNRLNVCCGIDELDLRLFAKWRANNPKHADLHEEVLAKFINYGVLGPRPIVFGLPVKVANDSLYDLDFYEWVEPILVDWGFKAVTNAYKNKNSGNTLKMLVGMLPKQ